jgi:predicted GTPase
MPFALGTIEGSEGLSGSTSPRQIKKLTFTSRMARKKTQGKSAVTPKKAPKKVAPKAAFSPKKSKKTASKAVGTSKKVIKAKDKAAKEITATITLTGEPAELKAYVDEIIDAAKKVIEKEIRKQIKMA